MPLLPLVPAHAETARHRTIAAPIASVLIGPSASMKHGAARRSHAPRGHYRPARNPKKRRPSRFRSVSADSGYRRIVLAQLPQHDGGEGARREPKFDDEGAIDFPFVDQSGCRHAQGSTLLAEPGLGESIGEIA